MSNRPQKKSQTGGGNTKLLLAITFFGAAMFAASAGVVVWLVNHEDGGEVNEGSFLRVQLAGPLSNSPQQPGFLMEAEDMPPTTSEIAAAIRKAAGDERIDGMYIGFDGVAGGWGSFQEVRGAIDAFTEAGKPCVAYSETWGNGNYYLASGCDQIVMAPSGVSMVMGLSASITYYAGAFEKMGVDAEFLHVGDFKSAVEPYERSGPSESASEAMDYMLDGLYDQMVKGIADGRGLEIAQVHTLIDQPALSPMEAQERGMVDALAYPDAVLARAHRLTEDDYQSVLSEPLQEMELEDIGERYTTLKEYLKGVRSDNGGFDDQIAVVHADGAITSGDGGGGLFGGAALTDRVFRDWMIEARENDAVKAVVVRVNSPGGSGLASDMMWREVRRTQLAGKPVVISMADYAASGGYFISAPADWIVAQPGTITGSIGVFGGKMNIAGLYEKAGLTSHAYKRGEESDLFAANTGFSEGGRAAYQGFLDDFYEVFLGKVVDGRGMERDAVHKVAQGRVWTGEQALGLGLVDELGGLDVALAKAADLANVDEYGVTPLPEQRDFFEVILQDLQDETVSSVTIDLGIPFIDTQAIADLTLLDSMLKDGAVVLLPGNVEIR
ncbi:MAG: signal peptide peptidase SppA [Rhodobacterales bacterium]|nr:signal peptide peptidase SppA [Rhodobacterales bacterium]